MNRSTSAASAAPFFIVLLIAVIVLGVTMLRAWHAHRRSPGTLRRKAHALWAKTGLHWSRPAYLTVHVVAGLLITMLAIAAFSGLADWISDQAAITKFDVQFDDDLHKLATPAGIAIAKVFSFIGGPTAMAALMIGGAIYLLAKRERLVLYGWLLAFMGGGALDWALKTIFHRDRPAFPNAFVHAIGFSFPSGHSMGSLIGIGMLAYLIIHQMHRRDAEQTIAIIAGLLVIAIGFSRLYLGAHYPSDVLGGFAAGIVWLTACITAIEASDRTPTG